MENINILKAKFIDKCNKIAIGKTIKKEQIYPNNITYTTRSLFNDIFYMCEIETYKNLDNETFEAITQENVLKIIEKGILGIFKKNIDLLYMISYDVSNGFFERDLYTIFYDYVSNAILRSGLQFLIDYSENYEDTKCDVKKCLQTILTHKNTIDITEYIYDLKNNLHNLDYLIEYNIDLTNIPLSHDWWKRD